VSVLSPPTSLRSPPFVGPNKILLLNLKKCVALSHATRCANYSVLSISSQNFLFRLKPSIDLPLKKMEREIENLHTTRIPIKYKLNRSEIQPEVESEKLIQTGCWLTDEKISARIKSPASMVEEEDLRIS
jgi:hypothetical protein